MKRREFNLLAGSGMAAAAMATGKPALAQSYNIDPSLLKTTLTPLGAERAGNADGSIPAWTGGLVSQPLPPNEPVFVPLFEDETPLYTVDANNMGQYEDLLTEATKFQIKNFGCSIQVFQTHRTAAAPQYVYDNTALNATRAKLDPAGGRFGFSDAYGGVPFPIIDTSDPLTAGAQLIWNHLTAWYDYSDWSPASPGCVMINGQLLVTGVTLTRQLRPYYDPDGSLETFDGYFSKIHAYYHHPASAEGQEQLVWHSANVNKHPDIVWTLLNGQGRVRKAPNEQFDAPNPNSNGIANLDESDCFYGNPSQYDWRCIGKKEMLIPYNCNKLIFNSAQDICGQNFIKPDYLRWEKHRVWIVEATLHPGEHNVNAKRRLYIDEDSWNAVLGEGYDANGSMAKAYGNYFACTPSVPGICTAVTVTINLITGDYCSNGNGFIAPYKNNKYLGSQSASDFEAQEMAASAAF